MDLSCWARILDRFAFRKLLKYICNSRHAIRNIRVNRPDCHIYLHVNSRRNCRCWVLLYFLCSWPVADPECRYTRKLWPSLAIIFSTHFLLGIATGDNFFGDTDKEQISSSMSFVTTTFCCTWIKRRLFDKNQTLLIEIINWLKLNWKRLKS